MNHGACGPRSGPLPLPILPLPFPVPFISRPSPLLGARDEGNGKRRSRIARSLRLGSSCNPGHFLFSRFLSPQRSAAGAAETVPEGHRLEVPEPARDMNGMEAGRVPCPAPVRRSVWQDAGSVPRTGEFPSVVDFRCPTGRPTARDSG